LPNRLKEAARQLEKTVARSDRQDLADTARQLRNAADAMSAPPRR
jgi:hypothetical protein